MYTKCFYNIFSRQRQQKQVEWLQRIRRPPQHTPPNNRGIPPGSKALGGSWKRKVMRQFLSRALRVVGVVVRAQPYPLHLSQLSFPPLSFFRFSLRRQHFLLTKIALSKRRMVEPRRGRAPGRMAIYIKCVAVAARRKRIRMPHRRRPCRPWMRWVGCVGLPKRIRMRKRWRGRPVFEKGFGCVGLQKAHGCAPKG